MPFHMQNTPNSDKSWESLLGHMISELTKAKDVYDTNSEEAFVVSHDLQRNTTEHFHNPII